ncbi:MAG TPA: DUF6036 family nucleotidyltransferase [Pseudomonadales bacterium]
MFITHVTNALTAHGVPYAIAGGHAVALHGALRGTVDIDFVIRWQKKHVRAAEQALNSIGLVSRLPITADDAFNFRTEYIQRRNLIDWSFYNPAHQDQQVDLLIHFDLGRKKTLTAHTHEGDIRYLNKADLIAMKRASGRPQDLADIEALESLP